MSLVIVTVVPVVLTRRYLASQPSLVHVCKGRQCISQPCLTWQQQSQTYLVFQVSGALRAKYEQSTDSRAALIGIEADVTLCGPGRSSTGFTVRVCVTGSPGVKDKVKLSALTRWGARYWELMSSLSEPDGGKDHQGAINNASVCSQLVLI